jgi:hypothetical protein
VTELKKIGESVRNFYRRQGWEEGYKAGNGILVKAVESAKAAERERIIKLLKDNIGWIEALEYEYWADELADLITGKDPGRAGEDDE